MRSGADLPWRNHQPAGHFTAPDKRVVDADENAEQTRFEVESVALPAPGEIIDPIPTNAAIDKGEVALGIKRAELRGNEVGVILPYRVVIIIALALASALGDRVALI